MVVMGNISIERQHIFFENIEVNNNLGYIHTIILKKVVISTLIKH